MNKGLRPLARRYLSIANVLLLLWSLGWCVSTDALSDWLRTEKAAGAPVDEFPSAPPARSATKASCNGGCFLLAQLQSPCQREMAIPPIRGAAMHSCDEQLEPDSVFAEPPYHPPRPHSFGHDD